MSETSVATAQPPGGGDFGGPQGAVGLGRDVGAWSAAELVKEIRETFALAEPHGARAAEWFYEHFFAANPRYRKYFSGDPEGRARRLFQAVQRIVADLDHPGEFLAYLRRLALRHRKFSLRAAHYEAFGASLLATMAWCCGERWDERAEAAWQVGYGLIAEVMLGAAAEADLLAPPFWQAEVTGHEMLTPDIARLTVRPLADPDRPVAYAFRAGQYAAIEVAHLDRMWRDFSFAGSGGAEGEVEFHVQAGRAGGVSEALVRRTAVGDLLRLAAAEGDLVFPAPDRTGRLLAVAHGTGAAPVYALVEAAVAARDDRPITVLLVSDDETHYLADGFADLARRHPALSVEQSVGDPVDVVRGLAAAAHGLGGCGAVLVGPGALVERCRSVLLEAGVDPDDVATDLFD